MLSKILSPLFVLGIIYINISTISLGNWGRVDIARSQDKYDHSQYCVPNCEFRGNIDDPELYTLAGYRYIEGTSPKDLNPELQPLTKYLFGLSTHLSGSPLPAQLLFGVATLLLLTYLSRLILPLPLALLPPLALSLDPLFRNQLTTPYLDLSVTMWVLVVITLLTRKSSRYLPLYLGLALGALSLSKSFSLGVLAALILPLSLKHDYKKYAIVAAVASLTYLVGYAPVIVKSGLGSLLQLHIVTLRLYKSYVPEYPKGEIFRVIFTGQWRTWWGDHGLIPSPFHSWLWPIGTISAAISLTLKKLRSPLRLHLLWVALLIIFSSLRLFFPRYLLPALPSLYLILTYCLYVIIKQCRSHSYR